MYTWFRNNEKDLEQFTYHVQLAPSMWYAGGRSDRAGYDYGGAIDLVSKVDSRVKSNEVFDSFVLSRRAVKTFFFPRIIVKGEVIPESFTTPERIVQFGLGTQYDMFISFASNNEAALFKMTFRDDINIGFDGVN